MGNEALLRQLMQSSQKKFSLFFTTDRLVQILDFGEVSTDRQILLRVTRKVLSNSKHTLLCLYGHHVLERTNLIPLKTLRWFAKWLEAQSLQGTTLFRYVQRMNRVGGKRSSFLPTFVSRPLTPPYVRFRIRRFLFWIPFEICLH